MLHEARLLREVNNLFVPGDFVIGQVTLIKWLLRHEDSLMEKYGQIT